MAMVETIKPVVLPAIFILMYASFPTSNVAYWNYVYTSLPFSLFDLHLISQFTMIGGLLGTLIYWVSFRKFENIRLIFVISILVAAVATCSRLLVLLAGWNSLAFICFDEVLVNVAARITLMPVQVYASIAASSPEHLMYEGFIFGFFASIENWGGAVSGIISGKLAGVVTLATLVIIGAVSSFFPLLGLSLLGKGSQSVPPTSALENSEVDIKSNVDPGPQSQPKLVGV